MYDTRSMQELPEFQHRFRKSSFRISDEVLDISAGIIIGIAISSIVFANIFSNAIEPLIK